MEEPAERSELVRLQREEEKERRRLRDRQRRQSMTLEQKERHLARRRRNYQLRRLRAASAGPEPLSQEPTIDQFQIQGQEKLNAECLQSVGLEAFTQKTVNVTTRLRLSQIRCLARSLNRSSSGVGGNQENVAEVVLRKDDDVTCLQIGDSDSGRLPNGLRLNCVKRLARTFNAVCSQSNSQTQVEQNLNQGESQLVGSAKHNFGQPTSGKLHDMNG